MIVGSFPNLTPQEVGLPSLAKSTPAAGAASTGQTGKTGTTSGGGFSNFLQNALGEVDAKLQAAETEKTKVLTGETNNLHQAVIAMQEANVAFSLMVEVRNKLVESYQELMRTQV